MTHMIDLDRIICPGCGLTGDELELRDCSICLNCDYETDSGSFPTVKEIMSPSNADADNMEYNNVRLDLFLKTLLKSDEDNTQADFVEVLETEIEKHEHLLARYISHKSWIRAGRQQEFIGGLAQALYLAMAFYVPTKQDGIK